MESEVNLLSKPQTTVGRFSGLRDRLILDLQQGGFVPRLIPERFAQVRRREQRGELQLCTHILVHADLGEVRLVTIESPRIDFINLFGFPQPWLAYPCYTMEMVVLGPKPILGAIDVVDSSGSNVSQALASRYLAEAHQRFPLVASDDIPAWYQDCRSGDDLFIRPDAEEDLVTICQAQEWLWQRYVDTWPKATILKQSQAKAHHQRQQWLRYHHRDNTPGLRLLERSFGQEWTHDFLYDWIFA